MQHQRFGDLRADAAQRIERRHRLLEDHGDAIAAQSTHPSSCEADQLPPLEADRTRDPRAFGRRAPSAQARSSSCRSRTRRPPRGSRPRQARTTSDRRRAAIPWRVATSTASSATSSSISPRLKFRIERVAQPIAKQIEAQHAERNRNARIEREPWRIVEDVLGVGEHLAPRGLGRLRAEAEIGKRRLGQNGDGELNRRLNDQRRRNVGQHVIDGDGDRARAPRRGRRAHIRARERRWRWRG